MIKTNIALIGFMGVGKSTIGKLLSQKLEKKLVGVDFLISQKAGKSIPEIFKEDGEILFRELEISVIKEISPLKNLVIDCGGGVVLNRINIDRLKQNAIIIWLMASPEVVFNRTISAEKGRPLLQGKSKVSEIQEMMTSRQPYYDYAADIKIDTSAASVQMIVDQILDKVK
jgi:shikimate kinase